MAADPLLRMAADPSLRMAADPSLRMADSRSRHKGGMRPGLFLSSRTHARRTISTAQGPSLFDTVCFRRTVAPPTSITSVSTVNASSRRAPRR